MQRYQILATLVSILQCCLFVAEYNTYSNRIVSIVHTTLRICLTILLNYLFSFLMAMDFLNKIAVWELKIAASLYHILLLDIYRNNKTSKIEKEAKNAKKKL